MRLQIGEGDHQLSPYFVYSLAAHAVLGAALLFVIGRSSRTLAEHVYTIDFVGPSAGIAVPGPIGVAAPRAAAPAPPPSARTPNEFSRIKNRPLPRPSLLGGVQPEPTPAPAAAPEAAAPVPTAAATNAPAAAGAGIETDLPNFPYPWYLSQIRAALWARWSDHMPRQAGECGVSFSILPNGAVVDLRTESSSGDQAYDLAALGAVQDSVPFPPLPKAFKDPFLKIHLTLKSQ